MNIIKKYWNSVYIYILLLIPVSCICAGAYWTIFRCFGYYSYLSWAKILLFDFSQLIYLTVSIYYIFQIKKDPSYILDHMTNLKCYLSTAMFLQYTFILVLFPSDYVWECTFIFLAASVVFFDFKMMIIHGIVYTILLFLAWFLNPEVFFPLNRPNYKEIIAFRFVIYSLTLLLIFLIVYFAERFLIQVQENEEENRILLEKQVKYYKNTELMDTELRKFRHDIINHFACMQYLLNNGSMEELNKYFQDLENSFTVKETLYFSGNTIIDAVLNNDLTRCLNESVNVTVYGSLPEIQTVSSMDLCTLFSNILSNAIDSANQCVTDMESELCVHFQSGKQYFSIAVSNSIHENDKENLTKKKNGRKNRNHGFGLGKIQEVIEKYEGTFEQHFSDNMITTEVFLPL